MGLSHCKGNIEGYTCLGKALKKPEMGQFFKNFKISLHGWRVDLGSLWMSPPFLGMPNLLVKEWGLKSTQGWRYRKLTIFFMFSLENEGRTMIFDRKTRISQNPRIFVKSRKRKKSAPIDALRNKKRMTLKLNTGKAVGRRLMGVYHGWAWSTKDFMLCLMTFSFSPRENL